METDVGIGYEIPIYRRLRTFASSWICKPTTSGVLYPASGAWENARWGRCFSGHSPAQLFPRSTGLFRGFLWGFPPSFGNGDPTYSKNLGRERRLEHCPYGRSGWRPCAHKVTSRRQILSDCGQLQVLMALNNQLLNDVKICFPHAEQPQAES